MVFLRQRCPPFKSPMEQKAEFVIVIIPWAEATDGGGQILLCFLVYSRSPRSEAHSVLLVPLALAAGERWAVY